MARVSTYLNYLGQAEEAFGRYAKVFGTEPTGLLMRMGEMPADPSGPPLSEADQQLIAHMELPILAGHVLMATDMVASLGHELRTGNNTTIHLEVDSRDEAERLYAGLAEGGSAGAPLAEMPWGAYWGVCVDAYGIQWMFSAPLA